MSWEEMQNTSTGQLYIFIKRQYANKPPNLFRLDISDPVSHLAKSEYKQHPPNTSQVKPRPRADPGIVHRGECPA